MRITCISSFEFVPESLSGMGQAVIVKRELIPTLLLWTEYMKFCCFLMQPVDYIKLGLQLGVQYLIFGDVIPQQAQV